MRLLVINPNSTTSMTVGILATARAAAAPDVDVEAVTNLNGPPAIQGEADGVAATPGVVSACRQAGPDGFDAAVIACFDDTGLDQARDVAGIPVIGIGHAAFLTAMLHGGRFSVITTLQQSVPVIEANIERYGLSDACAQVRASGLAVLSLESDPDTAQRTLSNCAQAVASDDGARAIVLGCAGMAPFGSAIHHASGLAVVDGVAAAVGLARTSLTAS